MGSVINAINHRIITNQHMQKIAMAKEILKEAGGVSSLKTMSRGVSGAKRLASKALSKGKTHATRSAARGSKAKRLASKANVSRARKASDKAKPKGYIERISDAAKKHPGTAVATGALAGGAAGAAYLHNKDKEKKAGIGSTIKGLGSKALSKGKGIAGKAVSGAGELVKKHPAAAGVAGAAAGGAAGGALGLGVGRVQQPLDRYIQGGQIDTNPNIIGSLHRNAPAIAGTAYGTIGAAGGAELASPGSLGRGAKAIGSGASSVFARAKALLSKARGVV